MRNALRDRAQGVARKLAIDVLAVGGEDILHSGVKGFGADEGHQDDLPGYRTGVERRGEANRGFDAGVLAAVDPCRDEEGRTLLHTVHERERHAGGCVRDLEEARRLSARGGREAADLKSAFHARHSRIMSLSPCRAPARDPRGGRPHPHTRRSGE